MSIKNIILFSFVSIAHCNIQAMSKEWLQAKIEKVTKEKDNAWIAYQNLKQLVEPIKSPDWYEIKEWQEYHSLDMLLQQLHHMQKVYKFTDHTSTTNESPKLELKPLNNNNNNNG